MIVVMPNANANQYAVLDVGGPQAIHVEIGGDELAIGVERVVALDQARGLRVREVDPSDADASDSIGSKSFKPPPAMI